MRTKEIRANRKALALSVMVLLAVAMGGLSCGDDDLFFPGELPPTPTDAPTATATPDDT